MQRSRLILGATRGISTRAQSLLEKKPDDVVITFSGRTAIGRAKKGQLKDTTVDQMLAAIFKAALDRTKLNPSKISDICVGTCHPPSPLYVSRAAALSVGIPDHVPISTVNRLCSSGLMSVRSIAHDIMAGECRIGIAAGAESMTLHPRPTPQLAPSVAKDPQAQDCVQPMGWTSEMVAQAYNISREKQDHYALISHTRASHAKTQGKFKDEIVPITLNDNTIISEDDTIRPGVTAESLAGLKSAFPDWPPALTSAGNASGVGDGAAGLVLMRRKTANLEGQEILGKWVGSTVIGVDPKVMGIGPVAAVPQLLDQLGLKKEDIDVWEINEAFASQFAYCVETLGLNMEKVNPNGGSIAISHPLGMTGTRLIVTGLSELKRRNEGILCTSMCVGSGMGAAAIIVNEAIR